MDDLTREQQKLLTKMYKQFLENKETLPFEKADYFGTSDDVNNLLCPEITLEHTTDICWAMEDKGYIICTQGDNLANNIALTDKTIIYMENRFKNSIKDVIAFIASLI